MCVNCVAQGAVYLGGAVGGLQVMAARARHKRLAQEAADPAPDREPVAHEPQPDR